MCFHPDWLNDLGLVNTQNTTTETTKLARTSTYTNTNAFASTYKNEFSPLRSLLLLLFCCCSCLFDCRCGAVVVVVTCCCCCYVLLLLLRVCSFVCLCIRLFAFVRNFSFWFGGWSYLFYVGLHYMSVLGCPQFSLLCSCCCCELWIYTHITGRCEG